MGRTRETINEPDVTGMVVDVAGLKRSKPLTVRAADDTPAQSWYRKHRIRYLREP